MKIPLSPGVKVGNLPKLSLVVPTYNESENITELIGSVCAQLDKAVPDDYEVIVVDDDSHDKTWKIAQTLMKDYPRLRVIRRQHEKGLATAVIRGWQQAGGEILGVIDGDLQHPPQILPKLLAEIDKGADLAVASRHVEEGGVSDWSIWRRIISRTAQLAGLILLPEVLGRVSDPMSGYFMVRRDIIPERILKPVGYKILIEVLAKGDIRLISEVGYVFQERKKGGSKASFRIFIEYLFHLIRLRFSLWPTLRFIKFCIVGGSGIFVDMAMLFLLSDPSTLAWGLTRSKIIAAETALINNFIWNDLWTFGDISKMQRGWSQRFKRLLKFNIICLIGIFINVLVLNILFNFFGINRYIANLFAIFIASVWNFWVNYKLGWRVAEVKVSNNQRQRNR